MMGANNPPRRSSLKDLSQTAGRHQGTGAKGQRAPHWQVQAKTVLSPVVQCHIKGLKKNVEHFLPKGGASWDFICGEQTVHTSSQSSHLPCHTRGHCGLEN